jgi:uncharacterized membrane protein YhaH (DUF805 family)
MDNLIKYFTLAFKKFADFNGRANKSEFWWFFLASIIISVVLGLVSQQLSSIYGLISMIPGLALGARRLHDIGKSGWMQLVGLIPIAGLIWLIVLFVKDSAPKNEYGEISKA